MWDEWRWGLAGVEGRLGHPYAAGTDAENRLPPSLPPGGVALMPCAPFLTSCEYVHAPSVYIRRKSEYSMAEQAPSHSVERLTLIPVSAQTAAVWIAWLIAGLVILLLVVFLLVQLVWTWKTEGPKATLVQFV